MAASATTSAAASGVTVLHLTDSANDASDVRTFEPSIRQLFVLRDG